MSEGLAAPRRKRFTANRHALGVDYVMSLPHDQRLGPAFIEIIENLSEGALPQAVRTGRDGRFLLPQVF